MGLELTTGTVASDGEDIYWELVANGPDDQRPVVVLSHGAGGSHAVWYQQVPFFGQRFRVLTWDSRGFGNSTNRNDAPSPEAAASDLAAVLDAVGIERAHLVGQSMGGWHMSAFALAAADRVLSLTYADTVGGLWTPALREAFAEFSSSGGLGGGGPQQVGRHRALWPGTAERDLAHAFLYQALGTFHSPPMHKLGATIQWEVPHEAIASLERPILFLAGTHDHIFPAGLLAESSKLLPGTTYVEIEDAGHSPYFEQPEAWNRAVGSFLEGQ